MYNELHKRIMNEIYLKKKSKIANISVENYAVKIYHRYVLQFFSDRNVGYDNLIID